MKPVIGKQHIRRHKNSGQHCAALRRRATAAAMPDATPQQLVDKKRALDTTTGTTHWPNALHVGGLFPERDGKRCEHDTGKPRKEVELTERGWKLTGIPYMN